MAPIQSGITTASCSLGCVARKKSKVLPPHRCCSIGSASLNLLRETDGEERGEERRKKKGLRRGSGWIFFTSTILKAK